MKYKTSPRWVFWGIGVFVVAVAFYFWQHQLPKSSTDFDALTVKEIQQKLKAKPNSAERIELLLAWQNKSSALRDMASVLQLSREVRLLAGPIGDSLSIAKSLMPIRGDIDFNEQKAIRPFFPGAIATMRRMKDVVGSARLSSSYGTILLHEGHASQAQSYLLYALKTFEEMDSLKRCINISMNVGSSYGVLGMHKESFRYNEKAIQLASKFQDSTSLASGLINRGNYFSDIKKQYNRAIVNFQAAARFIPKRVGFLRQMNDYNLALAYLNIGHLGLSELMLGQLLEEFKRDQAVEGIAMVEKGLSDVALKKKQYENAKEHLLLAIQNFDQLEIDIESLNARKQLREVYILLGDFHSAIELAMIIEKRNEKIFSSDKAKAFADMSEKYASEKKQLQIEKLESISLYQKLGILFLIIVAVISYLSFRYQRRIVREKRLSYSVLMKQYRSEYVSKVSTPTRTEVEISELDLYDHLCAYYENEKPYLDPKLKANKVAERMKVRAREISALLKSRGYNGFNEFTNRYRVEEVKSRLADPAQAHLKMESIAADAGFGSKQSFYSAFEEFTGLNPGYYREEIQKG